MKKISKLPEPYKSLAEKRREESEENDKHWHDAVVKEYGCDNLDYAFNWFDTPENDVFWDAVYEAKDESELPEIPEEK